ncbi:protein ROS1A-like [Hordeum vulgare subsp. vulgare]|uniref:Demeter RRM-fold domain-containing protein n=1 Tax=Hordeum vulgare subsp. vulgare TaxID=112509 RepID=A0A8I6WVS0_HORVV|nr:protein ROS1A-like [Hordeum vulgare subsp. vulgare]
MEARADLGPGLLMPPATPDNGRRPPFGSSTDAPTSCSTAAAPASIDLGVFDKHGFIYLAPPIGEQPPSAPAATDGCAATAQTSDSSDEVAPPGAAAAAATPITIPTPEKEESAHWRPRKKSTKGVPRLKVMKDKQPKPARATPAKPHKTPAAKKDGGAGSVGDGIVDNKLSRRRKLDFDLEIITGSFSRAKLMANLRLLAQVNNISSETKTKKKKTSADWAIVPYQNAAQADASCSALVSLGDLGPHGNRSNQVRPKVLGLDDDTLRVYGALTKWEEIDSESFEGVDIGSGPKWDDIRRKYENLVDWFIATVKDLFGPREYSRWGGSVIDSVVGTFLTQNVADHLSSNAFMILAAKFPMNKRKGNAEECSYVPPSTVDIKENLNLTKAPDASDSTNSVFTNPIECEEVDYGEEVKGNYGQEYKTIMEKFIAIIKEKDISTWGKDDLLNLVKDKSGKPICKEKTLRKFIATLRLEDTAHWDKLREEAYRKGYDNGSKTRITDKVNWEAVQQASFVDVAKCIAGRGQHYVLALRIQAFLTRIKKDHGSFDLDWLRYLPRESAKKYLISINGLGAKSVDCIRLLSLEHKAFPVDVNVARIVTRLQWVELQCCSEEFHSVDLYPLMQDVQSYLWPRLCTIDKEKLYELHCLMITFGKVICTKVDPNCNACPFRGDCRYYKSKLTRPLLPPAEEHVRGGEEKKSMVTSERLLSNGSCMPSLQVWQHQIEESRAAGRQPSRSCEPIIEVPPSPEYEYEALDEQEYPNEDDLVDIEDIMSKRVHYDVEINLCSNKPMVSNCSWTPNHGKDLALSNSQHTSRNLKHIGRLRTEHLAYVLPDGHALLEEFEERVPEDPSPYLLVLHPCPDDVHPCPDDVRPNKIPMMRGTILIPCRTASRGNFPLNGTYFQYHEVFADDSSSRIPIAFPTGFIDLETAEKCVVYFGSSIHSIAKGQTRQDIEDCFKKGYVCIRGFDRRTRSPRRLCTALHSVNEKKDDSSKQKEGAGQGKSNEQNAPSTN